jgi:hypothetical protein
MGQLGLRVLSENARQKIADQSYSTRSRGRGQRLLARIAQLPDPATRRASVWDFAGALQAEDVRRRSSQLNFFDDFEGCDSFNNQVMPFFNIHACHLLHGPKVELSWM